MSNFLNIILIIFISLIPILFWGFIFSYIEGGNINRKRFFAGIFAGALGVVPILYMQQIIDFLKISYLNIFSYLKKFNSFYYFIGFSFSLESFLIILAIFAFLISYFIFKFKLKILDYLKNIFVFFIFILFIGVIIYLLNLVDLSGLNNSLKNQVQFGDIVFDSFKLVVFYYIIVAFIEEASKHFNFLSSSLLSINSISQGVLYAIYIALGFSLVENILYFYNYQAFDLNFVKLYFYRSIFTIIVHIFASSLIAFFFTKAYLLYKNGSLSKKFIALFSLGIFCGVLAHLVFDVSLTIGFNFIIILYLIIGYFYVTSIFYRDNLEE